MGEKMEGTDKKERERKKERKKVTVTTKSHFDMLKMDSD